MSLEYIYNKYKVGKKLNVGDILSKEFDDKELIRTLSDVDLKEFLETFITHLKEEHKFTSEQIAALFGKSVKKDLLPISIFNNKELSCLETIVKYLKEELNLRFHEIALLLNRNDRTIWATYNNATKKRKERLPVKESKFFISISILKDRKFSVFESIVSYLKDNFNLRYSQIAILLNRDERNIWTVYNKAMKKKNE